MLTMPEIEDDAKMARDIIIKAATEEMSEKKTIMLNK